MKKRTAVFITSIVFVIGLVAGVTALGLIQEIKAQLRPDFTINIDGVTREFKNVNGEVVYPILYEGTTYLPVRAIGELMGKTVYWYEDEKRIELKDEKSTVTDADVIIYNDKADSLPDATMPAEAAPELKQPTVASDFIGKEKAQEIAVAKAGLTAADVIFDRTELDRDNGVWHYEVEFRQGRTEYDADIKADDGTILNWEIDLND